MQRRAWRHGYSYVQLHVHVYIHCMFMYNILCMHTHIQCINFTLICLTELLMHSQSVYITAQGLWVYWSSTVPQPGVYVTLNHTSSLYAGTGLTLICTVILDPNVDTPVSVMTEWSDIQEERYSVTGVSGSGSIYTDSLTISPLADQDDSTYTCTVTVTGGSNVQQSTASGDVTITVMGEWPLLILSVKLMLLSLQTFQIQ